MYESRKDDAVLKVIDFGTSQAFQVGEFLQKPLGTVNSFLDKSLIYISIQTCSCL